jgi:hypothetical protein
MSKVSKNELKLTRVGFMLAEKTHRELKIKAASEGLTVKEILTMLVDDYLKKRK